MKKRIFTKCFILLGLLLFFTLLFPYFPSGLSTVQAAETGKEKSKNYQLNLSSVILAKGKTISLNIYNLGVNAKITYKSDDKDVASVSDNGIITGNKVGDTVITVVIKDGTDATSLTCNVTVGPAAISVKWTQSRVIIGINNTNSLDVILKPSNTGESATYDSSDPGIVSVSPGGRITANDYGLASINAYIDALDDSGVQKRDTCTVIATSQDNVSKLEKYFSDHTELDSIPVSDLNTALKKFFNTSDKPGSSSTLISDLDKYLKKSFDLK
jgi:Bacterial Ig-like domain (group 2).